MFAPYRGITGHICASLAVFLVAVLVWNAFVLDREVPSAKLELLPSRVYPGEEPKVRLTITAPPTGAVTVLRVEDVYGRLSGGISLSLLTEDGKRVPGGPPHLFGSNLSAKHYTWLGLGFSRVSEFRSRYGPPKPGQFTLKVAITPDIHERHTLELEARLTCVEIAEKAVLSRATLDYVREIASGQKREKLQVMNVKGDDRFDLVFTRTDEYGTKCWRLLALEENSKVAARVKSSRNPEEADELWIEFDKGGQLRFLRVDLAGEILEEKLINRSRLKEDH